jgi:hypothetical protein
MMGPVRRKAMAAAQEAYAAASDGRDLIADLKDGFAAEVQIDWDLIVSQFKLALSGQLKGKGKLPFKLIIDPTIDA